MTSSRRRGHRGPISSTRPGSWFNASQIDASRDAPGLEERSVEREGRVALKLFQVGQVLGLEQEMVLVGHCGGVQKGDKFVPLCA